jgi:hypothetical protein
MEDVGSGGNKNTLYIILPFNTFALYIDESCRIIEVSILDLRTLSNATDLFDGWCVS